MFIIDDRYDGSPDLRTLHVSIATLKSIRYMTGNQCRSLNVFVMLIRLRCCQTALDSIKPSDVFVCWRAKKNEVGRVEAAVNHWARYRLGDVLCNSWTNTSKSPAMIKHDLERWKVRNMEMNENLLLRTTPTILMFSDNATDSSDTDRGHMREWPGTLGGSK